MEILEQFNIDNALPKPTNLCKCLLWQCTPGWLSKKHEYIEYSPSKVCSLWLNKLPFRWHHLAPLYFSRNSSGGQQDQTKKATCCLSEPRDPTSIKDILFRSPHLVPNVPSSTGSHAWNGNCIMVHAASMILVANAQLCPSCKVWAEKSHFW